MNYEEEEKKILDEKPYNPLKHFLFDLPEMFYFILKVFIIFGIAHIFIISMAQAIAQDLPALCKNFNL